MNVLFRWEWLFKWVAGLLQLGKRNVKHFEELDRSCSWPLKSEPHVAFKCCLSERKILTRIGNYAILNFAADEVLVVNGQCHSGECLIFNGTHEYGILSSRKFYQIARPNPAAQLVPRLTKHDR